MDPDKLHTFINKIVRYMHTPPSRFILVDSTQQSLHVMSNLLETNSFKISTSRFGLGNQEGSFKTPPGIHRIKEKIGALAPPYSIFKDRCDTGLIWTPEKNEENLILTRIIRLEGMEDGINRGKGIDSYERYIYIHGTNQEASVGTPISHGCICMRNNDIIELFAIVEEGTIVYID